MEGPEKQDPRRYGARGAPPPKKNIYKGGLLYRVKLAKNQKDDMEPKVV